MCWCLENVEDEDIKGDTELSCCMSCRVTCFDIFWPIIKKCIEITTMVSRFSIVKKDSIESFIICSFIIWWFFISIYLKGCLIFFGRNEFALMTFLVLLLPGTLECYYWIMSFDCHTNTMKCCLWMFFFNPLFFPFTIVAW